MNKEDYQRLQELALEMNDIMLANGLHEVSITTKHKTWYNNTNSIDLHTREYGEYAGQEFCFGSINISSDVKEIEGFKYNWDYAYIDHRIDKEIVNNIILPGCLHSNYGEKLEEHYQIY